MEDVRADIVNDQTIGKPIWQAPNKDTGDGRKSDVEGWVWDDELKNVRMLVVDGSFPTLKMMSMALHEHGALITEARDGQEAIRHCESAVAGGGKDFSVILTDIQMPNVDGLGEVRFVRAMEKELGLEPKIIVGISAYSGDHLSDKAMEVGMDAFLHKPFEYRKFMEVFNGIVQRRKNIAIQTVGSENDVLDVLGSGCKPVQPLIQFPAGSRILPQV